ncbi:glutamate racemase [Halanaerobium hydrogeniformans]|uniref:Glutamate racemase n=1 Tax=Halanaerobium hydrogeniformans TaxID=656519 RepID=E4RPV3_HALHG|nr:glutamate racemase [Halanaerobium hydrogeniformans]ADQ14320.1 glutamate racemase [Halanaerobium hydrogeniformans]
MDDSKRAIGLLDSGVGGLTVAREIFKLLPGEDIIYYGDTLHLPYGPKKLSEVREYVENIIAYLKQEKNVKAVVIACNTGSSAALDYVKQKFEIPIFGMIDSAAKKAVKVSQNNKIAVIGTEGTINSQAYQKAIKYESAESEIFAKACPGFVKLVEAGKFSGPEVEKTAYRYLESIIKAKVDVLILGCTHFPYLMPVLAKVMGKDVMLVNPAQETALKFRKELNKANLLNKDIFLNKDIVEGEHKFIVSDESRISKSFLEHGRRFLKLDNLEFKEENIFLALKNRGGNLNNA